MRHHRFHVARGWADRAACSVRRLAAALRETAHQPLRILAPRTACSIAACGAALACTEELPTSPVTPPPPPPAGSLIVVASVTGVDPDSDGFTVRVGSANPRSIVDGEAILFAGLPPAKYPVQLDGVATNCVVRDANPREATVEADRIATVFFTVVCQAHTTGGLVVRIGTPGFSEFGVSVDNGLLIRAVDGAVLVTDLAPGPHAVLLHVQSAGCVIDGGNPQITNVTAGRITPVYFTLRCPGGSLVVSVTTTGPNQPAFHTVYLTEQDDGYCYNYSCTYAQVGRNASIRFDSLRATLWYVQLNRGGSNCQSQPVAHANIPVRADSVMHVAFAVTCR